jgi:hypothetical protein
MSRIAYKVDRKCAMVGIGWLLCLSLWGQQPAAPTAGINSAPSAAKPFSLQPPAPKSPVDLFRSLLVMTPVERREFIAKRPPEFQKIISAKIQEYEGLKAEQRDLRLRVTELRWYLLPLLRSFSTNRSEKLTAIPDDYLRSLVEARLQEWDKLSPDVQKELLDNESTVRFYFELAARPPAQREQTVTNMTPAVHDQLQSGIRRWQALNDDQRQEIVRHFYEFFDLTAAERDKTLKALSEIERSQIDQTLHTFDGLTPSLRAQCLRSFQKFAGLTPEERLQFLKNAERWERMTPSERQSWRNLVSAFSRQPPLPPGLRAPRAPQPPSPLLGHPGHGPTSLVTETN